jgi:hypothetical protein
MPNGAEKPYERACRDHNEDKHTGEGTGMRPAVINRKPLTSIELRSQRATLGELLSESYYRHHRYGDDLLFIQDFAAREAPGDVVSLSL